MQQLHLVWSAAIRRRIEPVQAIWACAKVVEWVYIGCTAPRSPSLRSPTDHCARACRSRHCVADRQCTRPLATAVPVSVLA